MALVTLAQVKTELNITVSTNDTELGDYIARATPVIEDITGPVVQRTITNEQITVTRGARLALLYRPVLSITTCTMYVGKVSYAVTTVADPTLTGTYGATLDGDKGVLTRWSNGVQVDWWGRVFVTYLAGRASVPDNVVNATLQLIRHMWQTQRSEGALQARFPGDSVDEPLVATTSGYLVPNRVMEALRPNERLDGFA